MFSNNLKYKTVDLSGISTQVIRTEKIVKYGTQWLVFSIHSRPLFVFMILKMIEEIMDGLKLKISVVQSMQSSTNCARATALLVSLDDIWIFRVVVVGWGQIATKKADDHNPEEEDHLARFGVGHRILQKLKVPLVKSPFFDYSNINLLVNWKLTYIIEKLTRSFKSWAINYTELLLILRTVYAHFVQFANCVWHWIRKWGLGKLFLL